LRPAREGIAPIGKPVHADIASAMVGFLSLKKLMRLLQRRVRAGCSARRGAEKRRAQGPRAKRDSWSFLPPTV